MKKNISYIQSVTVILCTLLSYAYVADSQEASVQKLKDRLAPALSLSIEELQLALSIKIHQKYDGASVFADDDEKTFLGKVGSSVSSDSIFNDVGRYGSDVASKSIWNDVGRYGSDVASYSPFNDVTSSPPFIVKNRKVIGRLTVNDILQGAVDPNWLRTYYK